MRRWCRSFRPMLPLILGKPAARLCCVLMVAAGVWMVGAVLTLPVASAPAAGPGAAHAAPAATRPARPTHLVSSYGTVPLHFEPNRGQADPEVRFLSRGQGYALFLTRDAAVLSLRRGGSPEEAGSSTGAPGGVVRMHLVGANEDSAIAGRGLLPGTSNYFIGDDPQKWRTKVPNYERVVYEEIYRGIDLIFYGNQRQLEYDFIVRPGADPGAIRLRFDGADEIALDEGGNLVFDVSEGQIVQKAPVIYQDVGGERKRIEGRYILLADDDARCSSDP